MGEASPERSRWSRQALVIVPFLIFAVAFYLRWIKLDSISLWYDELQSVTFADRPFPLSMFSVFTYDCHPPLYYLFLSLWLTLGKSDFVVLLSSALLSGSTVVVLYYASKQALGRKHALLAASILAINPLSVFWSNFARMYSLLMLLAVLCFYANHLYLRSEQARKRLSIFVVLSELGVVYSHIAGFYFLFFIWLYFYFIANDHPNTRRRWIRLHILVGILGSAALHFPLATRGLGHMRIPGLSDILSGLSIFIKGPTLQGNPWVWIGAGLFVLVLLVLAIDKRKSSKKFCLVFLCAPFLLAILCSYLLKPMWQTQRTFAFFLPLFAIGLSMAFFAQRAKPIFSHLARGLVIAVIALMAYGTFDYAARYQKPESYTKAAQYIQENGDPGDQIVTSTIKVGWALQWYLVGHDWDANIGQQVFADWSKNCPNFGSLKCVYGSIRKFDYSVHTERFRIGTPKSKFIEPEGKNQIWTVARKKQDHDKLTQKYAPPGHKSQLKNFSGVRIGRHYKKSN